jgi:hypothetical protein
MRRGIMTILGAAVVAMSLVAATAAAFEPTSTEAEGPALADAQARLDAFTPPPGSQRVDSLPAGVATPQVGKLDPGPNLLEVSGYWMSTEPVDAVRAYLSGYRPPETTLMLSIGSSGPGFFVYVWTSDLPETASARDLEVAFAAAPEGGTAITAYSAADWIEPRLASSDIPAAAGFIEVTETRGGRVRKVSSSKSRPVASIISLANTLPIAQPMGTVHGCPPIRLGSPTLETTFRRSPGGPALAAMVQEVPLRACNSIGLTVRGVPQRGLVEGTRLARRLRLLFARDSARPYLRRNDKDCSDFPSQKAAQIFFLKHGGPRYDPDRLDADHDGIACEDNPAPYYFGKHLP